MSNVVLPASATLKGKDLSGAYELAKSQPDPEHFAMFKKKEPIGNMAKSLLKHRIQALTGKAATDIEEEMGYPSTREGGGVPVEVLRRLAHFLILEASGKSESEATTSSSGEATTTSKARTKPTAETSATTKSRKRGRPSLEKDPEEFEFKSTEESMPAAKKARASERSETPVAAVKKARASRRSELLATPVLSATPTHAKRASRRSMVPEMLKTMTSTSTPTTKITETVACQFKPSKTASSTDQKEEAQPAVSNEIKVEDLGLGDNPTQAMIAQRRRSLAAKSKTTPARKTAPKAVKSPEAAQPHTSTSALPKPQVDKVTVPEPNAKSVQAKEPEVPVPKPDPKLMSPKISSGPQAVNPSEQEMVKKSPSAAEAQSGKENVVPQNLGAPRAGFPGAEDSNIFLAQGNPKNLKYEDCMKIAPDFEGSNLTIIHTPADWEPMDIFNMTKSIRQINAKADLDSFLIMVGCGIDNMNGIHDALFAQTKHLQFVVFEREDQNLKNHAEGVKLREVTSYFYLAFFFPGCDKENAQPPEPMVRPGFTNCFRAKNAEDLENKLVYILTDKGDWILDLECRNRGICLAAQKSGRNALAIDNSIEVLFSTKEKAATFAIEHSGTFRRNVDGRIQHF